MKRVRLGVALLVGAALAAGGCGSSSDTSDAGSTTASIGSSVAGGCPTDAVDVVVTVDQWGDIVERLGGDCADVTTIITGSSADPHDFEPSPSDAARFEDARLVVANGLDYDHWAERAIDTLDQAPAVVDGGEVVGREEGDNPHIWYGPTFVREVADAVTAELRELAPDAATYFDDQHAAWATAMQPYDDALAAVGTGAAGKSYAATEPVFDDMAEAVGLTDATPSGYRNAALNESDPAPGDIAAFEQALRDGEVNVLIDNTQTEGPTPVRLREVAGDAGVPVVEVSETVPPGAGSFVEWQVTQLRALAAALGA